MRLFGTYAIFRDSDLIRNYGKGENVISLGEYPDKDKRTDL
ncbi:TPA: hypothetical protein ACORAD_004236 [Bacillus cereus]|nr:hypothetical protein [Bacillus mobilis]